MTREKNLTFLSLPSVLEGRRQRIGDNKIKCMPI
jgi:hypothetical protein